MFPSWYNVHSKLAATSSNKQMILFRNNSIIRIVWYGQRLTMIRYSPHMTSDH